MLNLRILSTLVLLLGLAAVTKTSKTATFENDRKDECFNIFKEMTENENLASDYFTKEVRQLILDCAGAKSDLHKDWLVIFGHLTKKANDDTYTVKSERLQEHEVDKLKRALRNVYDYKVDLRRLEGREGATFENEHKDECFNIFKEMTEKEDLKLEDFTMEKRQLIVDCVKSKKTQKVIAR